MQSSEIPLNEPSQARAGLTWQWRREDLTADYPASTWTLKYWMKALGSSGAHIELASSQISADGDYFAILVPASTTQDYTAGKYSWAAEVSGGSSEVYEIDHGVLEVLARYDQAAALDNRSHARKMLDAVESALETFASNPVMKAYTIGTRSFTRADIPDLLALRDRYRGEVFAEEMAERLRNGQGGNRLVFRL